MYLIGPCCQSVIVTASDHVKSIHSDLIGKYNIHKLGSNGRPIYKNSRNKYMYSRNDTDMYWSSWTVSKKYFDFINCYYNHPS